MIGVYTAITNGYDVPCQVPRSRARARYVLFNDPGTVSALGWESRYVSIPEKDNRRRSRVPKILSHQYMEDHEETVWMDGNVEPDRNMDWPSLLSELGGSDLAVFQHQERYCLYQEAAFCSSHCMDDSNVILKQVSRYTRDGMPPGIPIPDCFIMVRRRSERLVRFEEMWAKEVVQGSRRDQISFTYAAWRAGLSVRFLPEAMRHKFRRRPHANLTAKAF